MLTTLPPTPRDFEIHRLALVEFRSTRQIAEKFGISQTRVRQITARVSQWLTDMLPLKSEQDIEKEKRFAIHLAAAQLQHQIETLQNFWDGSGDPKYLRQQTRAILALARLGAHSHTLDSLAASVSDESPDTLTRRASEGQNGRPFTDSANASPADTTSSSFPTPHFARRASSEIPNPKFQIPNSPPPPLGDCSPPTHQASALASEAFPTPDNNSSLANDLFFGPTAAQDTLKGLDIMEQRLLSLINQTYPEQTDRRQRLDETLSDLRQSRANFILQLGPNHPVASPTHDTSAPSPSTIP